MIFIHVIGLVGAGKTAFIEKHLPDYPCFDIQTIYTQNHISPEKLKDPEAYRQYLAILDRSFAKFMRNCQMEKSLIGIIESSGANHGLNQLLRNHLCYSIWITPDMVRLQDSEFIALRPYAPALNEYLLELYTKRRLHRIDIEFNPQNLTFHPNLPAPLRSIFPEFRPFHIRYVSPSGADHERGGRYIHARSYRCPACSATFSKLIYLERHFSRMPHHQHKPQHPPQHPHQPQKLVSEKKPCELGAISHASKKFLS